MASKLLLANCTGLNNKIDPMRHEYDPRYGVLELQEAVNVDIDDNGGVSRRMGLELTSSINAHSLHVNNRECYVVADETSVSTIYSVGPDWVLSLVKTGLTKGARTSFWSVGAKTYYMNGFQKGVIVNRIYEDFPGYAHIGVQARAQYYPAPIGIHICVFKGRMWVAQGNVIWVSEPFAFGKYRMAKRFFQFSSDIRMMAPVENGVWVSDDTKTGFIRFTDKFEDMKFEKKLDTPAHEWSECPTLKSFIRSPFKIPGLSASWSCNEGYMVGDENGTLHNITEQKMYYPNGTTGASVIFEDIIINSIFR